MALTARHATAADLPQIKELCEVESHILEKHWGTFSVARLLERSAFSCCCADDKGAVIGFATLHHFPTVGDFNPSTWLEDAGATWQIDMIENCSTSNTMAMTFFFSEHLYEEEVLNEIIKMSFSVCAELDHIFLFLPNSIPLFAPLLGNFDPVPLQPNVESVNVSCSAFRAARADFMSEMIVRPALVEDHDDLVPVFKAQKENSEAYGEYFLANMISSEDENNKALVAEANGRAMGLLVLTADVQLGELQKKFELETYDFLVQNYSEEAQRVHEEHVQRMARLRAEHAEKIESARKEARQSVDEEFDEYLQQRADEEEEDDDDEGKSEEVLRDEKRLNAEKDQAERMRQIAEAEDYAVMEVGEFSEEPQPGVQLDTMESNAFFVTLFCLDPTYDSQVVKLLQPAFDQFPDKDYCIITIPHTSKKSSIMRHFIPIREKLGGNFSHALYICHRASLLGPLHITQATPADRDEMLDFLEEDPERDAYTDVLDGKAPGSLVYVTRVIGQIAGLMRVRKAAAPGTYTKYYELDEFIDPSHYGSDEHLDVENVLVNPIFTRSTPAMLKKIMGITGTCCAYCLIHPAMQIPEYLDFLTIIQMRRQQAASFPPDIDPARTGLTADLKMPPGPPTLLHTNFRLHLQAKCDVDTRIVVIGSSDAALSLLEKLIAVPYLTFHRITVVAPGGLPGRTPLFRHDRLNYYGNEMLWHGIAGKCTVVQGSLVGLDRQECTVTVAPDQDAGGGLSHIQYDHLILAPGLRDTFVDRMTAGAGGGDAATGGKAIDGLFAPVELRQEDAVERYVKGCEGRDMQCVVYGTNASGLDMLVTANRLLELGVKGEHIVMVHPGEVFNPIDDPKACELALLAAENEGIQLLDSSEIVEVRQTSQRVVGVVLADGREMDCGLVVAHGEKGVDTALFRALNDQSLVFDGRIVVDAGFKTNDPRILAGGDLIKFARRTQDTRKLDLFNQREIGGRLAEALLVDVDPTADAMGRAAFVKVPTLIKPLGFAGRIPGGLNYVHVKASPAAFPRGDHVKDLSRALVTQRPSKDSLSYSRLEVDKYGRVSSLRFLTSDAVPDAWIFRALVLLPITYLNDIVSRVDAGMVQDIRTFLMDDWARALYHDRFHLLREQLEEAVQTSEHMASVVNTLWMKVNAGDVFVSEVTAVDTVLAKDSKLHVQDGLNLFLECNADLLPGYLTAYRANEMQTNNVWGHTAEKVGLVVGDVPSMDDNV